MKLEITITERGEVEPEFLIRCNLDPDTLWRVAQDWRDIPRKLTLLLHDIELWIQNKKPKTFRSVDQICQDLQRSLHEGTKKYKEFFDG